MQNDFEKLIKAVYNKCKQEDLKVESPHPDEETLACFLEGRLSGNESKQVKLHLLSCDNCMESVYLQLSLEAGEDKDVPQDLIERVKNLLTEEDKTPLLEIFLRLKEKTLELINTTGDVLLGQELVPAAVLRSRSIKDFKDEVTILKDFKDIRVEVKIENRVGKDFNLIILIKQKQTQKILKDLRVSLIKDDLELESYLTDSGAVTFEHVKLGKYKLEISTLEDRLASILLDIKV